MTQADTRNFGYGLAASIALHLLLFVTMALWMNSSTFQSHFTSPPPATTQQPSVSLVFAEDFELIDEPDPTPQTDTPSPSNPAERYIRTTQNEDTENSPDQADFISDRNTTASAKIAPSKDGSPDMPTTEGVSFLTNELANRDYQDGETKDDSAPSSDFPPAPTQPPPPEDPILAMRQPDPPAQSQPEQTSESSLDSMMQELDQKLAARDAAENPAIEIKPPTPPDSPPPPPPTPAPRAIPIPQPDPIANTPRPQENSFQPHTRTAAVKGTISNRGDMDAVNAAATPTGRYMRQVTSTIERKWHTLRRANQDFVAPGKLRIRFYVNKDGKTEDISILNNNANAVLTDFSLTAILKADLPPIPKDLLPILEKERVEIEYDIVIY